MRCLGLAPILIAWPSLALAQDIRPSEEPFATARIGVWQAEVQTFAQNERANLPGVANIICSLKTNGLRITTDRVARIGIDPDGVIKVNNDGDEEYFSTLNVTSILLKGVRYETRAVATNYLPWRFTDIVYPREENDDIILSFFQGYLAVRRGANAPWLPMSSLIDELIAAKALDVVFRRHAEDDKKPRSGRFRVQLAGLGSALNWCQAQIASERAYRINP